MKEKLLKIIDSFIANTNTITHYSNHNYTTPHISVFESFFSGRDYKYEVGDMYVHVNGKIVNKKHYDIKYPKALLDKTKNRLSNKAIRLTFEEEPPIEISRVYTSEEKSEPITVNPKASWINMFRKPIQATLTYEVKTPEDKIKCGPIEITIHEKTFNIISQKVADREKELQNTLILAKKTEAEKAIEKRYNDIQ